MIIIVYGEKSGSVVIIMEFGDNHVQKAGISDKNWQ